jgi:hypothetical protein
VIDAIHAIVSCEMFFVGYPRFLRGFSMGDYSWAVVLQCQAKVIIVRPFALIEDRAVLDRSFYNQCESFPLDSSG